jgi:archaeal flagellar protein FlaI
MILGRNFVRKLIIGHRVLNREEAPVKIIREYIPPENTREEKFEHHSRIEQKPPENTERRQNSMNINITNQNAIELPKFPHKMSSKIFTVKDNMIPEKGINLSYPLIPRKPAKDEKIFAYAKIFWDDNANRYVYQIIEPELTDKLKKVMGKVKELLEQRLDIDFSKLKKFEAVDYLKKEVDEILKYFHFIISEDEKQILKYYIERDFIGLEKLEPIMQDPNIEDISCDGIGIPIFIFHRNPDIGSVSTNVSFDKAEELDSFLIRLSQISGKSISITEPLIDGMLPDGSRIQMTLATDIARRGSNFSIRKFTENPITPIDMVNFGTTDIKTLSYLWFVIDKGMSLMVSGGTASGKTSFLNILSLFIRPEKKIISIEDTGELKLPHAHWVPSVARNSIGDNEKVGQVDLYDLLRVSLRQRPDYTIVGEVRGKEAYTLFQQMATGHPSMATIHAENLEKLMDRLTTPPISLPASLINSVDLVIFLSRMHYKNKFVRKVTEVVEITGFDRNLNIPSFNVVYKWDPVGDKFEVANNSVLLRKISELTGMKEEEIKKEIESRMLILTWLQKNKVNNYVDIYKVFSLFYKDPQKILTMIEGDFQ